MFDFNSFLIFIYLSLKKKTEIHINNTNRLSINRYKYITYIVIHLAYIMKYSMYFAWLIRLVFALIFVRYQFSLKISLHMFGLTITPKLQNTRQNITAPENKSIYASYEKKHTSGSDYFGSDSLIHWYTHDTCNLKYILMNTHLL